MCIRDRVWVHALLWGTGARAGLSVVCTLPSAGDVGSGALQGAHCPHSPQGLSTPVMERCAGMWGGRWSGFCRRIPQTAAECLFFSLFLSVKFLLLNPAATYKEGPVLSHSPPLQVDWGLSESGPLMAQLSTLPSQHTLPLWVYPQ